MPRQAVRSENDGVAEMPLDEKLWAIEEIKQLKARYLLYLDTKEWDAWRELFTEDVRVEGTKQDADVSRDVFVEGVRRALADVRTCHHAFAPIITVESATRARGLWAMSSDLHMPLEHEWAEGYVRRLGYGHYDDEYRYVRGQKGEGWRISRLRLEHLWMWREQVGPLVKTDESTIAHRWIR